MATEDNTIISKETQKVIDEFGEELIAEIVRLLRKEDKVASGDLVNSFRWEVQEAARELNYILTSEEYFQFVDQGRGPGKQPPLDKILRWTDLKGIPQEAAFPIARNIGKYGIPATNILNRSIRKVSKGFEDELSDHLRDRIINIVDANVERTGGSVK